MKYKWNVLTDLPDSTNRNPAIGWQWVHTKADASERTIAQLIPNARIEVATATGPALLLRHNLDLGSAGGACRIGWISEAAGNPDNFSGLQQLNDVNQLAFILNNVTSFVAIDRGIQVGSSSAVVEFDTTSGKDLQIEPRGANAANGSVCTIFRRNDATPASGQRVLRVQESISGGPGKVDRFNVWSDNTAGQGGAGVPEDQFFSLDDVGSVRGDTGFRYDSAGTKLDCIVDGALAWAALAAGGIDYTGIAAPANPASGVRRLFTDTATGELSVRTNAGATVSLEGAGGGGITSRESFLDFGTRLVAFA